MTASAESTAGAIQVAPLPPLTAGDFAGFRDLLLQETGVLLNDQKRDLLIARLSKRLRLLAISDFGEYLGRVIDDPVERAEMIDRMMTNETKFFREPAQFDFLAKTAVPRWTAEAAAGARPKRLRVWRAGCSTGEEPYSVAMQLAGTLPRDVALEILATDLSTKALARAREAVWPLARAAEIPTAFLKAFMLRGTGPEEGRMKAGPELRGLVTFERRNLADETDVPGGPFDAILCRNVLIYFDAEGKRRVVARLLDHLAPGGYFFVGHAETLNGITDRVKPLMPCVYTSGPAPARGRARTGGAA